MCFDTLHYGFSSPLPTWERGRGEGMEFPSPSDGATSHSTRRQSRQVAGYPQPSPIKGEEAGAFCQVNQETGNGNR